MKIRWTDPALSDLSNICAYTEELVGAAQASKVAASVLDAVEAIGPMPNMG